MDNKKVHRQYKFDLMCRFTHALKKTQTTIQNGQINLDIQCSMYKLSDTVICGFNLSVKENERLKWNYDKQTCLLYMLFVCDSALYVCIV